MKKIFFASLACCLSISFAGTAATAGTIQEYTLPNYPGDRNACQRTAKEIAAKFTTATGYQVTIAECRPVYSSRHDIIISYQSDVVAKLVSTFGPYASFQGMYNSARDCDAALGQEQNLFEQRTGLKAVTAYCYGELFEARRYFSARIDGFGSPLMEPFSVYEVFYNIPEFSIDQLKTHLAASLAKMDGVAAPKVFATRNEYSSAVVINYYATRKRPISLAAYGAFENIAVCRQNRAGVENILTEFGVIGASTFCARDEFSEFSKLYAIGLFGAPFKIEDQSHFFATRQECLSAMSEIVASYSRERGDIKARGLCTLVVDEVLSTSHYILKIFSEQ